ncbi:MAG TPA: hypothetical protein VKW04_04105 [Planctomycetota bacterium]|nr:hypothetical protein [Planctomycetota bacterium]
MEIVYCGGCGKVLRGDDFDRGLARTLDNRPWCVECKPPDKDPIAASGPRKQGSSAKHARINVGTSRRESARPVAPKSAMIGLAVAVAGLLILGVVFMNGGSPPPPVVEKTRVEPVRPPPATADASRLLSELETLASLAPPDKILSRCEELSARFRGSPQEKRFREIETAARDQKRAQGQVSQLTRELDSIRKLIDDDPRYARFDEVVRRLKAARDLAGPRASEVDRRLAEYQQERQESPMAKHAGPFGEDEQGFIRHWLVLGVFPNDNDQGIDVDFLNSESTHDPAPDLAVGKLKWAAHESPEARVDFFRVSHLKIKKPKDNVVAYAACLVQTAETVAADFRLGSDDGGALWVDGALVGKVHKKRYLRVDEDRYAVPLRPGVHRVLVKVENHGGAFEFLLRILDADGRTLPGLKIWN